jgi:hypothetical protein
MPSRNHGNRRAGIYACYLLLLILPVAASLAGDSLKCDYCGKVISGPCIQYENGFYHPECYHQHVAPRCAYCGGPLGDKWVVHEGKNYHQRCYEEHVALRCSVCGGIIEGEYLVDHWGNKYHKYHEDEIPTCSFCGRLFTDPLAGGGQPFGRKHHVCTSCAGQAITDEDLGRKLLAEARSRLARAGIVITQDKIKFELASSERLSRLAGRDSEDHFGITRYEHTRFLGLPENREYTIYILSGLPKLHFISAAAHELMHVWMFLNTHQKTVEQLLEGSCNYAAALVLRQYDDEMAGYVLKQMDDETDVIYGEGFRRVKKMADNRGVEYWLQHLRLDPEFPIGY